LIVGVIQGRLHHFLAGVVLKVTKNPEINCLGLQCSAEMKYYQRSERLFELTLVFQGNFD